MNGFVPRHRLVVAKGISLWLLNHLGCDGLTMPWRTIYIRDEYQHDHGLIAHELQHVVQIQLLGPVQFSLIYLWQLAWYGYQRMPLEVEARRMQKQVYESQSISS